MEKIADLCAKYDVNIISDEIHCDITSPKKSYIPLLSVSPKAKEIGIALVAPTKAFNIAGIQTSALIIPNDTLRHYVNRGLNNDEIAEPNTFAIGAACAAFNYGHNWNLELREYIEKNKEYVISKLKATKAYPIKQDATYLMWIDIRQICDDSLVLRDYIRKHTGLYLRFSVLKLLEQMLFLQLLRLKFRSCRQKRPWSLFTESRLRMRRIPWLKKRQSVRNGQRCVLRSLPPETGT